MAQELNIRIDQGSGTPLYRQIYRHIRDEIRSGSLPPDERLPSTRFLSSYLHVARTTVDQAYGQLLSEGYIRAKRNSGYFVNHTENLVDLHLRDENPFREACADLPAGADDAPGSLPRTGRTESAPIDFSPRHTEMSAFPYSTWKRIMREVMVGANAEIFSLGEAQGDLSLRTTIAQYLHFSRGVRCLPEQVIVGAGNDYLFMLLRHILGEGRSVAMENPTYLRAAQIFRSFGYRICLTGIDADGMDPASVRALGADLAYVMPAHQFPMGHVMPVARRAALLGWAQEEEGRYILEDDYDSEFRFRGKPIPALQSLDRAGRVIYMGTFSKAIAPAIRVSYMILPPGLLGRYRRSCHFFSSTVSRIDQRILDEFMKNGHFERYLNRMRGIYRTRHDVLCEEAAALLAGRFAVRGAGTGLHIVLEESGTPASDRACMERERELAQRALERGVRVYCLSEYFVPSSEPVKALPSFLLGFGALEPEAIREGMRRLAKAWG